MIREVEVSNDILTLFNEVKGPLCIREIEERLDQPREVVLMTLGWFMREGFIDSKYLNGDLVFILQEKGELQY